MIVKACRNRWHGWAAAAVLCVALVAEAAPALSQPSQAQISAVRSNCRSDYMAHCSSVPPGGAESLNCLQSNSSRLSGACRSAVEALKPPAAETPAPRPAAAPAPAAAPVQQEAPQQRAATPAPQAQPAAKPPSRPAPQPRTAAAPPPAPAVHPAEPTFVYTPMPPLLPRMQLQIIRACDADRQAVCGMVPMGGGRIIECLARNEPALSPFCRQTIQYMRSAATQ